MQNERQDEPTRGGGNRLLIVDDNPGVVQALATRMGALGYEVLTALDGHDAMCLMADPGIDALVTDLDMPYLDGFALLDLAASFKPCRCVVITGSAENAMRCYRAYPGLPVLLKPFKSKHVETALRQAPARPPRSLGEAA